MEWEPIRLRRHRWELKGTLYFEFQPGASAGGHWQPGSVYVYEEFWADLEVIVARHAPAYGPWGHYGRTSVVAAEWACILAEFDALAAGLRAAAYRATAAVLLPWLFGWFEPLASPYWRRYVIQYAALTRALSEWVRGQLADHDTVTVLGI